MKRFSTPLLCLALFVAPAGSSVLAQTPSPTPTGPLAKVMGYFVGTWNCKGGPTSNKPRSATVEYEWTLGNTMVEEQVDVPAAGKMPAYRAGSYASYAAKAKHVISSGSNMYGDWDISWTAGWKGAALSWADVATSDGKLGKDTTTRLSSTAFDDVGYDNKGKLVFRAHCDKAPAQGQ
jgi:hypothetical protein